MIVEDAYAEIAPYYDLEFDNFDDDVELYAGYVQLVGGPVLELGCGTGRLLKPLAELGVGVIGYDNSQSMLNLARQRLVSNSQRERVELTLGDMRDLSAIEASSIRMVIVAVNSFLHLETTEAQLAALRQIRRVLNRDGILIIDVFNPLSETLLKMDDRVQFDGQWQLHDGQLIQRFSHRQLDSSRQLITTNLFYDRTEPDGSLARTSTSYRMRYVHRFELELLLTTSGFEMEGFYGSYALDQFEQDSDNMIAIAHRTANPGENDS
jgi:ubiquinone/menaquinone biosynthesis C-methylase UbiE